MATTPDPVSKPMILALPHANPSSLYCRGKKSKTEAISNKAFPTGSSRRNFWSSGMTAAVFFWGLKRNIMAATVKPPTGRLK